MKKLLKTVPYNIFLVLLLSSVIVLVSIIFMTNINSDYKSIILILGFGFILYSGLILGYLFYRDKKWYKRVYEDTITRGYSGEKFKVEYDKIDTTKALIVMDINQFSLLNKHYGYEYCSKILKEVYDVLDDNLKNKGFCYRELDDRFIICLTYKRKSEIIHFIERIDSKIKETLALDFGISLAYGICECKDETLVDAESKALAAWKNVKKFPGQNYAFYEEEKLNLMIENRILLDKLEKALKENKLSIYFQAKYDVKTKKIIGSEALLRWQDDDGSFISPQRFIPSAEETGLVTKIDSYVLNQVCSILASLKKEGLNPGMVSINVSRNKLGEKDMVKEYETVLKKYKISKKEIELEITEGTVLSENQLVHTSIETLIHENFGILIDDFGTRYSSISMLKSLQMKGIKIDRAFVMDETKKGKEILKYVVTLAKGLNLETIAEGVEEESQYKYLKELGCDGIQGYYFSKPMPLNEYRELLSQTKKS